MYDKKFIIFVIFGIKVIKENIKKNIYEENDLSDKGIFFFKFNIIILLFIEIHIFFFIW